jgi:alpha-amylase
MTVTQEWELADDLGDSHSSSLLQGGALPNNSTECRKAGTIYPEEGTELNVEVFAEDSLVPITLLIRDNQCNTVDSVSGLAPLTLNMNVASTDWHNLMVRNAEMTNPGQKVWVKAMYQAPADASVSGTKTNCSCIGDTIPVTDTSSTSVPTIEEFNLIVFPNPNYDQLHVMSEYPLSHFEVINIQGQQMANVTMNQTQKIWHHDLPLGVYFIRFYKLDGTTRMERLIVE